MEILCRSRRQAGTEDHGGSGGPSGAAIHRRPILEQSVPEEWTPWYKPILELFLKNYCLWEAHIVSIWEGLHPMRGTPQWKRGRVRMKEWQRWSAMGWPQCPVHLWCLGERGRRGQVGRCFMFAFNSYYSSLLSIDNKFYLSSLHWICLAHDNNWWVIFPAISQSMIFYFIFSVIFCPLVLLRRGSERAAWWCWATYHY